MTDCIVFEDGKEARLVRAKATVNSPKITDENGNVIQVTYAEFTDAREDDMYGYLYAYNGDKPKDKDIFIAIDTLKPKGSVYEKP